MKLEAYKQMFHFYLQTAKDQQIMTNRRNMSEIPAD